MPTRKIVRRKGKKVRKLICPPGSKALKGRCVRMKASERVARKKAAKRGARKSKAARIRSRKRTLRIKL